MFGGKFPYSTRYLVVILLVSSFWSLAPGPVFSAITFTGFTTTDFQSESCIADPGGEDVGMPNAFPQGEISGFDIHKVCLSYDPTSDRLYVGIQTFIDPSNQPIIFGDADGNGDEAQAGTVLQTLLGDDKPDLDSDEFFTLVIDFDADEIPDLVVGKHNENALSNFAVQAGSVSPDNHLLLAPLPRFYGSAIAGVSTAVAQAPTHDQPHLEFSITGLSNVPEFAALDPSDPDSYLQIYIATGSFDDDGISEEYFPSIVTYRRFEVELLLDSDGDTINNLFDLDNDNDTLSDLEEKDLSVFDENGDGILSDAEVADSGLDTDGDGDIDSKDVTWPDDDGDGTPNYLDNDSDNDGIPDGLQINVNAPEGGGGEKPLPNLSSSTSSSSNTSASETRLGGDVDLTKGAVRLQGEGCSLGGGFSIGFSFWWALLLLWFGIVPKVWALRADHYQSSMEGLGFLNAESAKLLPLKKYSLGVATHLMHNPLGFGVTSTGQSLDSIVNVFWVWDFWGATTFREDLEMGLHIPVSLFSQVEDLNATTERNTTSMGDIRLLGKWRFFKDLSLISFLDLPAGEESDFFGESNVTGGLKVVGEQSLGAHTIAAHLGFFGRGGETVTSSGINLLEVGPEMLWGLGWLWPFSHDRLWGVQAHLWGKSDFDGEATSPTELDFGLQKSFASAPLQSNLGLGFGLNKGYGAPTYRIIFGMHYSPGTIAKKPRAKQPRKIKEESLPTNESPKITAPPVGEDEDIF